MVEDPETGEEDTLAPAPVRPGSFWTETSASRPSH